MASSKLMNSRNSDPLRRLSSISNLTNHHRRPPTTTTNFEEKMTVDGVLRNNLLDAAVIPITDHETNAAIHRKEIVRSSSAGNRTSDDVWKGIVAGRSCKQEVLDEMMTLEDFLAKAGAVDEEDVKVVPEPLPTASSSGGIYSYNSLPIPGSVDGAVGFVNGVEMIGGRGKRKPILDPCDKAAQQRQRRMIKNRESAARSRERKQAYQAELESLVVKLEEEHEMLLKEKAEQNKERFKQLMKNIIPVVEKRRPARVLKRVRSMEW